MADETDQTKMPDNEVAEWGLVLAKSAVSLIPFAGGPAAEVLGAILQPHIEQRRTEWLEGLAREQVRVSKQVEGLTPEALAQSPAFASAFLQASAAALRTHLQEKLDALRNAVLNVAAGTASDDNLQLTFIRYVDELTPWHLALLDCVADRLAWAARRNFPVHSKDIRADVMFEAVYRDVLPRGHETVLLQDLYVRGLATNTVDPYSGSSAYGGRDPNDLFPRITDLGTQFLAFISAPRPPLGGDSEVGMAHASAGEARTGPAS